MARIESKCPDCGASPVGEGSTGTCPGCGRPTAGAPKRRPGKRSAIVAAAAIAIAGVVIYLNFPEDLLRAPALAATAVANPPAKQAVSDGPDKAEIRTPLVVARVGKEGAGRAVVALGRPVGPKAGPDGVGTRQGILLRELVRQAILIAARDGLGLATRDESLDDVAATAEGGQAAELSLLFRPGACRGVIRRVGGEKEAEAVLKVDLGTNPDGGEYASNLAEQVEGLSRKEFVAALEKLGAAGSANKVRAEGAVPEKVEERLSSLGLVENFAAVRDLHAAIRADGESPERLGALARAYVQLGVLTEFHWHPAHKVFKARALLYAERLATREPGSAAFAARLRDAGVRPGAGRQPGRGPRRPRRGAEGQGGRGRGAGLGRRDRRLLQV